MVVQNNMDKKYLDMKIKRRPYMIGSSLILLISSAIVICALLNVFTDDKNGKTWIGVLTGIYFFCTWVVNGYLLIAVRKNHTKIDIHKSSKIFAIITLNWFAYKAFKINDEYVSLTKSKCCQNIG